MDTRVGAYAVIVQDGAVLLSHWNPRHPTLRGAWSLPGGGMEIGEQPAQTALREVHEETGQRVEDIRLLTVLTRHWVGRAPGGRVEDFHAVRLFHTAHCPEPTDPVVLDVGGSTSDARWVGETELASLPLASSVPQALAVAGVSA